MTIPQALLDRLARAEHWAARRCAPPVEHLPDAEVIALWREIQAHPPELEPLPPELEAMSDHEAVELCRRLCR